MDRSYESGTIIVAPTPPAAPSTDYPTGGDAGTGVPATEPGEYWFHMITEELRKVIVSSGLAADSSKLDQLYSAIERLGPLGSTVVAGGAADALTATFVPAYTALTDGMVVVVRAAFANATTTPTFDLDTLGGKTIVRDSNQPLAKGDIPRAEYDCILKLNLTNDVWELLNPAKITSANIDTASFNPIVQQVHTKFGEAVSTTATFPVDDTIPQNTEGAALIALDTIITPKSAINLLMVEIVLHASMSGSGAYQIVALFQDAIADALDVSLVYGETAVHPNVLRFVMIAGSTAAITFKARIGVSSSTMYVNANSSGSRVFGGVMSSSMTVTEIKQ